MVMMIVAVVVRGVDDGGWRATCGGGQEGGGRVHSLLFFSFSFFKRHSLEPFSSTFASCIHSRIGSPLSNGLEPANTIAPFPPLSSPYFTCVYYSKQVCM